VRNFRTFEEVVPVADSAFLHLWIGNQPEGVPLPEERLEQLRAEQNQARRYNMLARDYAESVQNDPAGTLARRLWSGLDFLFGKAWFDPRTREMLTATSAVAGETPAALPEWLAHSQRAILPGALLAMLILGFLGWRWTYPWRIESRLATL